MIFELILVIDNGDIYGISWEIVLRWMSLDLAIEDQVIS